MDINVLLLVLHVCLAFGIISLVLLQKGKGASEGATFGGGATSVFGASGSSNFLSKTTAILATGFFINSLALAYLAGHRDAPDSLIDALDKSPVTEMVAPALDSANDVPPSVSFGGGPAATDAPPPAE